MRRRGLENRGLNTRRSARLFAEAITLLPAVDDFYLIAGFVEVGLLFDRLLAHLPSPLQVIVSTRYPFASAGLVTWRARGEVLKAVIGFTRVTPSTSMSESGRASPRAHEPYSTSRLNCSPRDSVNSL